MKTLNVIIQLFILFVPVIDTLSQELPDEKINAVYLEFLGPAGIYSINYDRILYRPHRWLAVSGSAGISVYNNTSIDLPIRVTLLAGPKSHKLEVGGGFEPEAYLNSRYNSEIQVIWFYKVGYRYQRPKGGPMFEFAINPLYYAKSNWKSGWVCLGLGWCF
jgi:hypothetical protein